MQFPRVPGQFSISSKVFNSSQIAFSPKPNYVQQTLDFSSVLPLFNAVSVLATSAFRLTIVSGCITHIEDFVVRSCMPQLAGVVGPTHAVMLMHASGREPEHCCCAGEHIFHSSGVSSCNSHLNSCTKS